MQTDTRPETERPGRTSLRERIEAVEHPELVTLMAISGSTIVLSYVLAITILYPIFAFVPFPVYVLASIVTALGVSLFTIRQEQTRIIENAEELTGTDDKRLIKCAARMSSTLGMDTPRLHVAEEDLLEFGDEHPHRSEPRDQRGGSGDDDDKASAANEDPDDKGALNAFATGTRRDGHIVFTRELYERLDRDELEAVLGHEMAHLYYYDNLVSMASVRVEQFLRGLAAVVAWLTVTIMRSARRASRGRETRRQARWRTRVEQFTASAIIGSVGALVMIPRNALSRYREFVADKTAARLTDDPEAMISALETLEANAEQQDSGHLYPINPVDTTLRFLYATHPQTDRRIEVIRSDFDTSGEPVAPSEPGPTLGSFTKFGLTAAPAILVVGTLAIGVTEVGELGFSEPHPLLSLGFVVGTLAYAVSLFTFPWAMLFAAGGARKYGLAAVGAVGMLAFTTELGGSTATVGTTLAAAVLMTVAVVQLLRLYDSY